MAPSKAISVFTIPINKLNREAVAEMKLSPREADRCKNFFALGLVYWLYERPLEPTLRWIREKFAKNPAVMEANTRTLKAGYNFGETTETMPVHYRVAKAEIQPGRYRKITGNEALAIGLVTATQMANLPLVYASYPITPASDILHHLAELKKFGVLTLQAEDEIAAVGMAIGAAFGGSMGVTATSGPGICLKSEAIGLAVMTELPLIIIDVQRGGPSTGLPTKTEQADLLQAMFGRNGECPAAIVAPCSPADCFQMAFEAVRIVDRVHDTGVAAVGWLPGQRRGAVADPQSRRSCPRSRSAIRPSPTAMAQVPPFSFPTNGTSAWSASGPCPARPGLEHRIGGIEKEDITGNVSYDPANHEHMVKVGPRRSPISPMKSRYWR